jgi:hypothetical protein
MFGEKIRIITIGRNQRMIKEKINRLIDACKDDSDMLDIIQADVLDLGEYTQAVYSMEFSSAIIREKYEGEKVRDALLSLDD